ncbi:MAG: MFS transporter [Acidobacteriota bacterium]|nr:MFS transporter [Acidobacteriota bacterium]
MNVTLRTSLRQWIPCVSMLLLSLLSYADRSVLSILSPTILADLHLNVMQYGYAVSAFSLCYMVANPVWGLWIDRRGVWTMALLAVLVWSVASGSHALMTGMVSMCVARAVLGFGEGATFPSGLATVAETLPPEHRSFGLGLAYSGGSLGATLTPLLITPVALHFGWRATFLLTSAMGGLWILLWLVLRSTGLYARHHAALPPQRTADGHRASRWNRNLLATVALYGLGAAPLAFGLYAAPLYLSRVLHVSQASLGHLLWIPPAGWETGYLVWGRVADLRRRRTSKRPAGLFLALALASVLIAAEPLAARMPHPVLVSMLIFYLEMFFAGGFVVLVLSDGMQAQPGQSAGFLSGSAISSWALVTALLTPWLGHLFDQRRYGLAFWWTALLPLVGVALWQALVVKRPVAALVAAGD